MKLDYITQKNSQNPNKAIVFIHGWSGNKMSFLPLVKNLKIKNVEWFLPEAPYEINNDQNKRSWTYKKENGVWEIKQPMEMMRLFFDTVIFNKYSSKDVFVIGFSQGASVCYEYIMGIDKPLGGIFPIGGFLWKDSKKLKRVSASNKNTPILIGHGINDDVIPIEKSEIAYNQLLEEEANVKFYKYNGGHKISMSYIKKIIGIINGKS